MSERPGTAFTLSLVGVTVQIVAALVITLAGLSTFGTFSANGMMGGMMGGYYGGGAGMMGTYSPWGMTGWGGFMWLWIPILAAAVGVGVFGVFLMNKADVDSVRTGSILVLVAAVLAFPTAFGFIVGSLLMIMGAILGLTWSPIMRRTG